MTAFARSHEDPGRRYRQQRAGSKLAAYAVVLAACLVSLYPMWMMLVNSFKADDEVYINPGGLPISWTLESYGQIFEHHSGLWLNFVNALIVSGVSVGLSLLLCALAAYGFSKYRFKGRGLLFALLLVTMMVPMEVSIPGLYILFAKIRQLNTLFVQMVPHLTPMLGLFLMRQYMLDIPDEMLEAARVDGAGHFRVFWEIMLPVCTPVLGAYAILHFLDVWNAYTWPAIVAQRINVQPIMVVLPQLVDTEIGFFRPWGTIMAGCVLSTIPIMAVFVKFQDFFLSSMVIGSVKG